MSMRNPQPNHCPNHPQHLSCLNRLHHHLRLLLHLHHHHFRLLLLHHLLLHLLHHPIQSAQSWPPLTTVSNDAHHQLRKSRKIVNPTRAWDPVNVFDGLQPWTSTADFGTMCHSLIGYSVRYNNAGDALYRDAQLAENLTNSLRLIAQHLPDPPPHQQAPWGPVADWYHFTITMPEVFMNITAVLYNTTHHYGECTELTIKVLDLYLPTAVSSLGWTRTAGNAMRMGIPYVYGQLLRGRTVNEIRMETSVQVVLDIIAFPFVVEGDGLHVDSIYIDHIDVRAYGYLINSFFTFNYYKNYFGRDVLNDEGLTRSIQNVASPEGIVNPAVMSRNGTLFSNVIGAFVQYPITVHSADHSKVLTKLSNMYYGCVVGTTPRLAYYEADPTNNVQGPLWAMNRRIWNRSKPVINYTVNSVLFESGVLCQTPNGLLPVPSTTTSTQSFRPQIGETAIVKTNNTGAMLSHSLFAELNDLQFVSCTLYYDEGMFQLYYNMGVREGVLGNNNGRVVVLARDTAVSTPDATFAQQREDNGNTSDGTVYNGVVCYRVPITGLSVPSLSTRVQGSVEIVEQVIGFDALHNKEGVCSYKLNVEGMADNLKVYMLEVGVLYAVANHTKALFRYPYVALKDGDRLAVSSVEESLVLSEEVLNVIKNDIQERGATTPVNCVYNSGVYTLTNNNYLQFWFDY
ncbi:ORF37 ODV-E66 [Cydia pomonella granulovirus]|uniref:ORF37 ODV-E66 n=1 Tax=Cydia pomonella granulosis virus (isolate Mexico/1963) TaxID=654905 RepID=Q91F16_GVCPM|nr:ORF37 ODV-E66 [Cydia pomonella granulovirus]AAK70697.1 ORF37 ODV-E66 [Cydia pomonella granulovirus]